jgi:hypothetical protein
LESDELIREDEAETGGAPLAQWSGTLARQTRRVSMPTNHKLAYWNAEAGSTLRSRESYDEWLLASVSPPLQPRLSNPVALCD